MRAIAGAFASVRPNPGSTAAARSTYSRTDSAAAISPDRGAARVRHPERADRVLVLGGDAQRRATRRQDPQPPRGRQERGDLRRCLEHLLQVVEHEQRRRRGECPRDRLDRPTTPAASARPSAWATVGRTSAASRTGDRSTNTADGATSAAASASRVLPVPPGPVSVSNRTSASAEQGLHRRELELPSDERGRRRGQPAVGTARSGTGTGAARSSAGSWRRIACSSSRSSAPGSMPSSSTSTRRGVSVGGERVSLAAGAVERAHQLRTEPLAQRVLADERFQLADEAGMAPELEVGVEAELERPEPLLLECRDLPLREGLVGQVGEGRPAPERERLAKLLRRSPRLARRERLRSVRDERGEPVGVELPVPRRRRRSRADG